MSVFSIITAKAFRPFFALASIFAVVIVPMWILSLNGGPRPHGLLQGTVWHAHEMVYGYTVAVIAGFLLTAVENWTQRPTLRGKPLAALCALWVLARLTVPLSGWFGPLVDLLFLPGLMLGIARPLIATRNMRNLIFLVPLSLLWLGNLAVYADVSGWLPGTALAVLRASVIAVAMIIAIVASRIIPAFTRNATGVQSVHNIVVLDRLALASLAAVLVAQLASAPNVIAATSGLAGLALATRSWPWWTRKALGDPLLLILHAGHGALALGLLLAALPLADISVGSAPIHVLTVGSIGLLTLGMMARVALGHTGRPLRASRTMSFAFTTLGLATLARGLGPWLDPQHTAGWWWSAAGLWSLAFALYVVRFLPILAAPRVDGKPG